MRLFHTTTTTMSTNLYDLLDIEKDATPEQSTLPFMLALHPIDAHAVHPVRKAYKKRALQTHPDRLPAGSTPEDKALAEEEFRKVDRALGCHTYAC